jgi:DNA helicase IV
MSLLWRRRRELHPDQIRAIEGLSVDGRYLLLGPPGSGKTSILLHRGQYLRLPPHNMSNVRLVTFTRTLREFIAVSGDDRFPPGLIQTNKDFVDQIFRAYSTSPPNLPEDMSLAEKNRQRAISANQLLASGPPRISFDALLVDEIQDLSGEEVTLFGSLSPKLMMVGDSRQKLFDEVHGGIEAARTLGCEEIELKHHFRISRDICRVADSILLPGNYRLEQFNHYQGPTPSPPSTRSHLSKEQQLSALVEALDVQLDTYNEPTDLIGLVTWRKQDCDLIAEHLGETRFAGLTRVFHSDIEGRRFETGIRICVITVQSCKGLEFRALHWLFADEVPHFITRERAYTVVTRAKSSLTVYHHGPLQAFLAVALPAPPSGLFEDDDE